MNYNFGEKSSEWSRNQKKEVPVWISPKFEQTKKKAIETIEKYKTIEASDFWILMNETKSGKMGYTGLIISHNGCLKINDEISEEKQFNPDCISIDKEGYNGSLVYTYSCQKQGIYEVGEVSIKNCKNDYPYAMAFKRCFDRVVLKLSKLAYSGIYSDSEEDEFKEKPDETRSIPDAVIEPKGSSSWQNIKDETAEPKQIGEKEAKLLIDLCARTEPPTDVQKMCKAYKVASLDLLDEAQYGDALAIVKKRLPSEQKKSVKVVNE